METYTLPTIRTVNGVFEIEITSISEGLTLPSQTVKSLGKLEMQASVTPEDMELSRMTITVMQDTAGFWPSVLLVDSVFFITVVEPAGGDPKYVFSGRPEISSIDWNANSNFGDERTGEITFTLNSLLNVAFEVPMADYIAAVKVNAIGLSGAGANVPNEVISINGLFSTLLSVADLNPDYDENDTEFLSATDTYDLKFKEASVNAYVRNVGQLYVPVEINSTLTDYWHLAGDPNYLGDSFGVAKEFISALLKNFACRMVLWYDMSDDRYKIKLLQAYRAYDNTLSFTGRLKAETLSMDTNLIGDAVRASFYRDATKQVWISAEWSDLQFYVVEPSTGVQFCWDGMTIWKIYNDVVSDEAGKLYSAASQLAQNDSAALLESIKEVDWYDYAGIAGGGWVASGAANDLKLEEALAGYFGSRYIRDTSAQIKGYYVSRRTYWGITADDGVTDSIDNVVILMRQAISLGFGAGNKNYFANKITIDLDESELEVEWILEEM